MNEESQSKDKIIFNIYGMLQSLFVGIDALYSLSYGITNRKWSVNVNLNPNLREIKYVRNDVVGHPTKRTYEEKKTGYCDLNIEKTEYYNLVYKITIPTEKSSETTDHNVDLRRVINNYYIESDKLLVEIYNRMLLENPNGKSYLSEMVYRLFREYKKGIRNLNLLENIRTNYMNAYKLNKESQDRYLWRLNILEELFNWDMENHEEIISYLINSQLDKLYKMSVECDQEKANIDFANLDFKYKMPNNLKVFKAFLMDHNIKNYVHLSDNNYPLFDETISCIRKVSKDNKVIERICDLLQKNKNNTLRIYALGTSFFK